LRCSKAIGLYTAPTRRLNILHVTIIVRLLEITDGRVHYLLFNAGSFDILFVNIYFNSQAGLSCCEVVRRLGNVGRDVSLYQNNVAGLTPRLWRRSDAPVNTGIAIGLRIGPNTFDLQHRPTD